MIRYLYVKARPQKRHQDRRHNSPPSSSFNKLCRSPGRLLTLLDTGTKEPVVCRDLARHRMLYHGHERKKLEITNKNRSRRRCLNTMIDRHLRAVVAALLHPLQHHRDSLAYPDTHGAEGVTALRALQLSNRRCDQPRPARAQRMAERDRSAIGIDVRGVVRHPSCRSTASACAAKASFNSITSISSRSSLPGRELFGRGNGPHAHDAWRHARRRGRNHSRFRREAELLHRLFRSDDQPQLHR